MGETERRRDAFLILSTPVCSLLTKAARRKQKDNIKPPGPYFLLSRFAEEPRSLFSFPFHLEHLTDHLTLCHSDIV